MASAYTSTVFFLTIFGAKLENERISFGKELKPTGNRCETKVKLLFKRTPRGKWRKEENYTVRRRCMRTRD